MPPLEVVYYQIVFGSETVEQVGEGVYGGKICKYVRPRASTFVKSELGKGYTGKDASKRACVPLGTYALRARSLKVRRNHIYVGRLNGERRVGES